MSSDLEDTFYNLEDLIPIWDSDGEFFDFALKSGDPIITDYSRVNAEIVAEGNQFRLGKSKKKSEIKTIDELKRVLDKLICIVHMARLDIEAPILDENKDMLELLRDQILFDILYDKYLKESPWLTLYEYCREHVCYKWLPSKKISRPKKRAPKKDARRKGRAPKKDAKPKKRAPKKKGMFYYKNMFLWKTGYLISSNYLKAKIPKFKPSKDDKEEGHQKAIDSTRKWMTDHLKREINNNPYIREFATILEPDFDPYDPYNKLINEPNDRYKAYNKNPKAFWDNLYYNGNPNLITSKQHLQSFRKNKKYQNYSYEMLHKYFETYDRFIQERFKRDARDSKDYFNLSMDFYHLEIYNRIDFIYKLAVKMESKGQVNIDKEDLAVKRFLNNNFWPDMDHVNDCIVYSTKHKYYRPLLFIEEELEERIVNDTGASCGHYFKHFNAWQNRHIERAKVYEIFNYHYEFVSDDYDDMVDFIRNHYDVLTYHDPNKQWIVEGPARKRKIRIRNALEINKSLFADSDKRMSVRSAELNNREFFNFFYFFY